MERRCEKCNRGFQQELDLQNHLGSLGHIRRAQVRCSDCNMGFVDQQALSQHLCLAVDEVCTQFRCCDCNRDFVSQDALLQHLRDKVHMPKPPNHGGKNVPCGLCTKLFKSELAMKMHEASQAHKPLCDSLYCIGSNGCQKRFNSPSSMILHLESGSCPSGVNRDKLNAIMVHQDSEHQITCHTAMETVESSGGSCVSSEYGGAILTPSSSSPSVRQRSDSCSSFSTNWEVLTPVETSLTFSLSELMTPQSDNIEDTSQLARLTLFVCPLCPPTSNRFRTARDLDNHKTSPVHAPKIFHCPAVLFCSSKKKLAQKRFSTLSGLAMHVESGACGKQTFRDVLNFVNERLKDFGIREICLI
jgi:hypothetical protein